jgi:hypothetical protein
VIDVILDAARVRHAHAREREPLLILEIGNLFGEPMSQRVRLPTGESRLEQTLHILRLHGSIGDTAGGGRYLNERLEP